MSMSSPEKWRPTSTNWATAANPPSFTQRRLQSRPRHPTRRCSSRRPREAGGGEAGFRELVSTGRERDGLRDVTWRRPQPVALLPPLEIPGLQRVGKNQEEEGDCNEFNVPRPYLSEAWEVQEYDKCKLLRKMSFIKPHFFSLYKAPSFFLLACSIFAQRDLNISLPWQASGKMLVGPPDTLQENSMAGAKWGRVWR
ncbi:hypothetical protein VNO80_03068 [Phaseolus coccineus]|uniref:Uncharacterized protein n=1 Tax=Phaseolus coccineus TaxID=3886 RepID=A0AAN9NQM4_PHACN